MRFGSNLDRSPEGLRHKSHLEVSAKVDESGMGEVYSEVAAYA